MFTPKVGGNHPTFGFVENESRWLEVRDDPRYLIKGMPQGIGEIRRFDRQVHSNGKLVMYDGEVIPHWGFRDENGDEDLPSAMIRVSGGDLVQCELNGAKRQHTIHWHGIEPDMDNDGVGHSSFEVTGSYIYQWRAHPENAGTYFYHCHVNTALHVQMGMFGGLIIDPAGTKATDEYKKPFNGAPDEWAYNVEGYWAPWAVDARWHKLKHHAGVCGEDVGLNRFNPEYFTIGRHSQDPHGPPLEQVAVRAKLGDTIYLRTVNANYHPVELRFEGLDPLLVEVDGRAIRDR